ncbi:MAG: ABC transporter permease [Clostridiales bacterium]|nr:ABC transporter permease [Clostridiales bacterium]
MLRYIIRRLLLLIPTLLCVTVLIQLLIMITPGDPVRIIMGTNFSQEEMDAKREELGLNNPFHIRYFTYMGNMLLKGDFGTSYKTGTSALSEIMLRFPYTLMLVVISMAIAIIIGIPTGIYAATHQYSWKDNTSIVVSLFCVSMPSFWFALILIQFLCVKLGFLPVSGIDRWQGWVLPAITLALGYAAAIARQMRSSMLETIRQDFITTARAKGQSELIIRYRHALKNAVIPVIMTIGSIFGMAMGGSMITEIIFSLPGLGKYTLDALSFRDYPVIQTTVLFMSAAFAIVLLISDILFAIVDPRIRAQYSRKKKKLVRREAA